MELDTLAGHEWAMAPTDAELWHRAVAGDAPAFGLLFERHARTVYNYCFRRTANWSMAEDLTSVVFLEAWRKRGRVRLDRDSALPWLLGVATNVLRNRRRSERRHQVALARLPVERAQDLADDVSRRLDDEQRARVTLRAFAKLPRRDRDLVALSSWAGLTYEEIGVALDIPVGTVRSRLSRARARLLELADADGHERDCTPVVPTQEA